MRQSGSDLGARIAHSALWSVLLRLGAHLGGLAQALILARLLSPREFGLFGIAMLLLTFLETFSEPGFRDALIQRRSDIQDHLSTMWTVSVMRGVVLALLMVLLALPVASFFQEPEAAQLIAAAAAVPVANAVTNPATLYFQRELTFQREFRFRIAGVVVGLVTGILSALLLRSAWALVLAAVASAVAQSFASFAAHSFRPRLELHKERLQEMARFGKWVTGASMLKYVIGTLPDYVVARLAGSASLGHYQMANRLASMLSSEVLFVLRRVAFPAFAQLQGDQTRLVHLYLRSQRVIAVVVFPLYGLIIALSERIVSVLLGPAWVSIAPVLQLLAVVALLQSVGAYGELLRAVGRPKVITVLSLLRLAIIAVSVVPLVQNWGLQGAAAALALSTVVVQPLVLRRAFTAVGCRTRDFVRAVLPSAIAAVLMGLLLASTEQAFPNGLVALLLLAAVGLAVFATTALLLDWAAGRPLWLSLRALGDAFQHGMAR
jgi:O-antigen/teichoic acid export membrane protein